MIPPGIRYALPGPTRAGWAVLAIASGCATAGLMHGKNLLLLSGCLLAGIWLACGILSVFNLRGLEVRRTLSFPLFAGASSFYRIRIENPRSRLPARFFRVLDWIKGRGVVSGTARSAVTGIPPREYVMIRQLLKFARRGEVRFQGVMLESTYPLGLFRAMRFHPQPERAVVYPRLRPVPPALLEVETLRARGESLLVPASRGDEEFAGLREFRPGDNPKWIHWRSSARGRGRLLVKELEGIMPRRVTIVLETRLSARDIRARIRFERAVSLSASLAHALAARQFALEFHIRTEGGTAPFEVASRGDGLHRLLQALALLEPPRGEAMEDARDEDFRSPGTPCLFIRPEEWPEGPYPERTLTWE